MKQASTTPPTARDESPRSSAGFHIVEIELIFGRNNYTRYRKVCYNIFIMRTGPIRELNTGQTLVKSNRLISTSGVRLKLDTGVQDMNLIFKYGLQYGYDLKKDENSKSRKLTPYASLSLVYKGVEVGILPGTNSDGKPGHNSMVLYFSTGMQFKF